MDKEGAENIILRLKRIEGQVRGIQKMIANEVDCAEIMNQVAAVKSAIGQVGVLIFKGHAYDCLVNTNKSGSDQDFEEIITLMSRFIK